MGAPATHALRLQLRAQVAAVAPVQVTANALAYFADQKVIDDAYGLGWAGTAACQVIGAGLLLLGSFFYLYWSTATAKNGCACITP